MDPAQVQQLVHGSPSLFATQYCAIAGLVALLWDHLLTLNPEIQLIWKGKFDATKVIFLFNRYFVEGTLIYAVYVLCVLRQPLDDEKCKVYMLYVTTSSVVAMALENFTLSLRIQAIWDHRRHITYILIGGFLVTHAVTCVFAGYVIKDLSDQVFYEGLVAKTCIITERPVKLLGVWAGMVSYDVFVCFLVTLNALNRPYRQNKDIVSSLHTDGLKFYLALAAVRLINLLLSIFTGAAQTFLIVFLVWSMISITLSRLLLRIEAYKIGGTAVHIWRGDIFELAQYE